MPDAIANKVQIQESTIKFGLLLFLTTTLLLILFSPESGDLLANASPLVFDHNLFFCDIESLRQN